MLSSQSGREYGPKENYTKNGLLVSDQGKNNHGVSLKNHLIKIPPLWMEFSFCE